jgi:hypothetical protein
MNTPPVPTYRCSTRDGKWSFTISDGDVVIVGRSPELADVVIPYLQLARRDVLFRNEGGVLTADHMKRHWNLYLNNEMVIGPVTRPLLPGDEIMLLPNVVFVVEIADQS